MKEIDIIIPAAGLATRMKPITNNMSKAMVPVNGKPVISWILDSISNLKNVKIRNVFVVYKYDDLGDYIINNESYTRDFKIILVKQNKNLHGPGGAVLSVLYRFSPNEHRNDNYLIWLGDTICLYDNFDFDKSFLATTKVEDTSRWCVVKKDKNGKTEYYNKVSLNQESDALIGIYYMDNVDAQTLLFNIDRTKEIEISDVLSHLNDYEIVDVNKEKTTWFDCGELDSYYKTCGDLLNYASRAQTVIMSGENSDTIEKIASLASNDDKDVIHKLHNEYEWYSSCSNFQNLYIPLVLNKKYNGYVMSKCSGTTLSDMFIYENIHQSTWCNILSKLMKVYSSYFGSIVKFNFNTDILKTPLEYIVNEFYIKKSIDRLDHSVYNVLNKKFDIPFIKEFIWKTGQKILDNQQNYSYIYKVTDYFRAHGDFHFGNILFEANSGKFTFLDPRGGDFYFGYTHALYDIAKIYHDLYCEYFLILQNKQGFKQELRKNLLDKFTKICNNYGYDTESAKRLSTILVFTCLPFHTDNLERCNKLAENAYYLMKRLEND